MYYVFVQALAARPELVKLKDAVNVRVICGYLSISTLAYVVICVSRPCRLGPSIYLHPCIFFVFFVLVQALVARPELVKLKDAVKVRVYLCSLSISTLAYAVICVSSVLSIYLHLHIYYVFICVSRPWRRGPSWSN